MRWNIRKIKQSRYVFAQFSHYSCLEAESRCAVPACVCPVEYSREPGGLGEGEEEENHGEEKGQEQGHGETVLQKDFNRFCLHTQQKYMGKFQMTSHNNNYSNLV